MPSIFMFSNPDTNLPRVGTDNHRCMWRSHTVMHSYLGEGVPELILAKSSGLNHAGTWCLSVPHDAAGLAPPGCDSLPVTSSVAECGSHGDVSVSYILCIWPCRSSRSRWTRNSLRSPWMCKVTSRMGQKRPCFFSVCWIVVRREQLLVIML